MHCTLTHHCTLIAAVTAVDCYFVCRLLRWGASTAADAARLQQEWLEHSADPSAQVGSTATLGEVAEAEPKAKAATQGSHWQQQSHDRHRAPLVHWTTAEPDTLPGAPVQGFAQPGSQSAQLRHASAKHMIVERSGSNIPMLLEDAEPNIPEEAALTSDTGMQQQQHDQVLTSPDYDAVEATPVAVADTQQLLQQPQAGQSVLCNPVLQHAVAAEAAAPGQTDWGVAAGHAAQYMQQQDWLQQQHGREMKIQLPSSEVGHADPQTIATSPQRPQQPQVLRHRQRPGMQKGKAKGPRGILSLAQRPSHKVAPEETPTPPPDVSGAGRPNSLSADNVEHDSKDELVMPAILPSLPVAGQIVPAPMRMKYRRPEQPTMHAALQQSVQQVRACTLQFEEQSMQQQAMRGALQSMTTNCGIMQDIVIKMQNQRKIT